MLFEVFISLILFIYGAIFGSFLNVVILRTAKKEQFVKGRSRCFSCGHTLSWYDLFPIFSWLFLGGRCRYCGEKISSRYILVETLTGLSYVVAFLALGIQIKLIFALILFPILICTSFFDIDTGEVEYWCPISIGVLGVIATILSATGVFEGPWREHLIGMLIISVPFAILSILGAMGGADVQLMAAAGLLLGWKIVPASFIGVFSGAIIGVIMKAFASARPSLPQAEVDEENENKETGTPKVTVIKFAPFLSAGIAISFLFGDKIISWYLTTMGIG